MVPGPGIPTGLPRRSSTRRTRLAGGGRDQERDRRRAHVRGQYLDGELPRPGAPDRLVERRHRDPGLAVAERRHRAAVGCFARLSVTVTPSASNVPSAAAAWTGRYAGSSAGPPTATVSGGRLRRGGPGEQEARRAATTPRERARAPPPASIISIMRPPCSRRRRSCRGPTRAAAACSGSTTASTGGTAPSAGGRPAPAFEVVVGAILTQNAAWRNAERAIARLRAAGRPRPSRPSSRCRPARLAALLRPSGTFRVKARRLRAFARHVARRHGGRLGRLLALPLPALRAELRGDPGHRAGDGRRHRALCRRAGRSSSSTPTRGGSSARHRLVAPDADYATVQTLVMAHLPHDPALFNEFHALLVRVGKEHCRTRPRCEGCPLRFDLRGRPPRL